jgi:hypothetical protein
MAKLIVTRKKQVQSAIVPLAISVDGVEQDGLRSGGRLEVDLSPGQHRVVVGNDATVAFENSSGKETHIEVWISTFSSRGKAVIKS